MFVTEMGGAHVLSAIWVQESERRKTPPGYARESPHRRSQVQSPFGIASERHGFDAARLCRARAIALRREGEETALGSLPVSLQPQRGRFKGNHGKRSRSTSAEKKVGRR